MEKELFLEFVTSYFYKKGYNDAKSDPVVNANQKTMSEYMTDCKKAYKVEIDEKRKDNPHHHTNRLD